MTELSRKSVSTLGWRSRGYLPHFDGGQLAQFITFRLYDSLPREVIVRWKEELKLEQSGEAVSLFRRKIEAYLDQGFGSCYLKKPDVARTVETALLFHDVKKYKLSAWVVMPNHVHILCTPAAGYRLAEITHSIKSFTSNEANKVLDRSGRFWQKEYFDRFIRNPRQFARTVAYIENNPVKANLCDRPEDWPFSSARLRKK